MPSKKNRSRLAKIKKQQIQKIKNKGIYLITERHATTKIEDIVCEICAIDIICDCYNELDKPDSKRACAYRRQYQEEFPLSQYTIKYQNHNTYLIHICSSICNEKFNIIQDSHISQLQQDNPDVDITAALQE